MKKKRPKLVNDDDSMNLFLDGMEFIPQHVRVVTRTALTAVGLIRSAIHHGLASLAVSEHRPPVPPTSWKTLRSPSMAFIAEPPLAVLDWLADFLSATLVATYFQNEASGQ